MYFSLLTIMEVKPDYITYSWLHYLSLKSSVMNLILVSIGHLWDIHCNHSKHWHICQWRIREVDLHEVFGLHFRLESRLEVFSCLCCGQSALCMSQLSVSCRTYEWNIFRIQRKCSEKFKNKVPVLSQLILSSLGSGRLSAFKWDEMHLKTVTSQVSEESQILPETNLF